MYFVVLSYPRTGSTVIQRLINTDKSSICVGEKPMTINHLYDFYASIESSKFDIPNLFPEIDLSDDRNPLFNANAVDMPLLLNAIKGMYEQFVLCPRDFTNIGWKENFISSYADGKLADEQIHFIRSMFPGVKFVLNVRNPEKCAESMIWKIRDGAIDEIEHRMNWMTDGFNSGLFGYDAILMNHDEWSQDGSVAVKELVNFGFNIDIAESENVLNEHLNHLKN